MIAALCTLILLSIFRRTNRIASIMAGVMILCGMAYIWRFIRLESLPALMENISSILHDPEHVASYSRKLADLLNTVYSLHLHQYLMLAACVFVLVCLKPSAFADCAAFWSLYFFASCAYCLWFVSNKIHTTACYVILVILVLSTLPLVPLFWRSRRPKLPLYFYGGGLVLAAVFFLASNTLLDAMTVGFCFSSIGGILMLSALHPQATRPLKHAKTASRLLSFAASLLIAMMVVFSAAHRFIGIYRDAPLSQLNTELHVGPAKGLITTPENARQYESIYQTITTLSAQYPDVRALHSKRAPWAYLCANWRYGTPTSWTMDISSAHLQKYHALYPDKRPSLIFLYSSDVGAFSPTPFNNHTWDPSFNQNNLTGALYDQIKQTGSVVAESEFVTVYHLDPIRQ